MAMEHLREIDDINVRHAVDLFQTQMELFILNLLGEDREVALVMIDKARRKALNHVKNLGSEFSAMDDEVKTIRIAISILEKSYERLQGAYGPDGT
jgi:hypothetical protein